uniref:Uncharacterized protein n=1 Tax=Culex quinquefasciatus TaxID=7176 RepID=A0A1S4JEV0_CULQU
MLFLVLLFVIAALITLQYARWIRINSYSKRIPSVEPIVPILGHIPMLCGINTQEIFEFFVKSFQQVDRMGKIMLGPVPMVMVNHPDLMEQILTNGDMYNKPFLYDFFELGVGLITERDGEKWKQSRKALNRTFNSQILRGFLPLMDARVKTLVQKLEPYAGGGEIDLLEHIAECTLEMIFTTTMGRCEEKLPGQTKFLHHVDLLMKLIGERIFNVNQFLDVFYRMTKSYQTRKVCEDVVNEFTEAIIQTRREELEKERRLAPEQDEFHSKLLIFLDQVLTIRKGEENTGFTDREILDHLLTIMGAGQDTSAYAVAYTLLLLAMNPNIQNKVVEEIDSVFSSNSVEVTVDTLQQLKYTEQVIKESLRLLPVAPILGRETSKEIELDGVRIPPNQMIMYNLYALHRRPDVWGPDPERFDPDRFGPEAVTNRHPYAYLPFSGGLRNCIGWRYALNSMRIILLRILQNYELKTDLRQSEMRFKFEITMKLIGPHRVWLTERPKRS